MELELTIEKEFEIKEFNMCLPVAISDPTREYTFKLEEYDNRLHPARRDKITLWFNDTLLKASGIELSENYENLQGKHIVLTLKSKPLEGKIIEFKTDELHPRYLFEPGELLFMRVEESKDTRWRFNNLCHISYFKKEEQIKYAALFASPQEIRGESESFPSPIHWLKLTITQEQYQQLAGSNTPIKMQVSYRLKEK